MAEWGVLLGKWELVLVKAVLGMLPALALKWAVKYVPARWVMPGVLIGPAQERPEPAETWLRWWQIPISVSRQRRWESDAIEHCRLVLLVNGPHGPLQPLELLWPTKEGPKDKITLRVGESPYLVPVVLRSEIECWVSGDPVRLPPFHVPARVARISDANTIVHRATFTDLPPSVWYRLTLQIRSGATDVGKEHYRLRVPDGDSGNEKFTLQGKDAL